MTNVYIVKGLVATKTELKSLNDTSLKRRAESANLPVKEVQEETNSPDENPNIAKDCTRNTNVGVNNYRQALHNPRSWCCYLRPKIASLHRVYNSPMA